VARSHLIDKIIGNLEPEIGDGAPALGDVPDRAGEAGLLERDRMQAEIGCGFTLGIVPVGSEAVTVGDLLPQRLAFRVILWLMAHSLQYEPRPIPSASRVPRGPRRLICISYLPFRGCFVIWNDPNLTAQPI
jgi:hypothetical protein